MLIRRIFKTVRRKSEKDSFYGFLVQFLGRKPRRKDLYLLSFRHKSVSLYEKGEKLNNERLEFLGDAILDAVVADIVFQKFPKQKEGFLTKIRSKIVSRKQLNRVGKALGIEKHLLFNGTVADNALGNCIEALVGAIYLDFGYERAKSIVEKRLIDRFVSFDELQQHDENFKSKLVEWAQSEHKELTFATEEKRKDGRPYFYSDALLDDEVFGKGEGCSKKQSQQLAAESALEKVRKR